MKNRLNLAVLCLLAVCAAARGQGGPKLVSEKVIMQLDHEKIAYSETHGAWCMRLSPDGRRVLYLRLVPILFATSPDGGEWHVRGYEPILRDLKTGKDTPVPVPAMFYDEVAPAWVSMTVFDPAGKTLVVPVGQDADKNGRVDPEPPKSEKSKPGLYDIASGTLKTLDLEADLIFPTFSPNGKMLVLVAMDIGLKKMKVHVTPTDKISLRLLGKQGLIRSVCPTSEIMGLLLITRDDQRKRPGKFVLYDLKADTVKAELADAERAGDPLAHYNPQWTGDGRYLYFVKGSVHSKPVTRIWDAKLGKEAGVLADTWPIGPGPGKNTMVLGKGAEMKIVLHAQGDKALGKGLHSLGGASIRPISTQGKWLLFIRKDAKGNETACMAEIALPKK